MGRGYLAARVPGVLRTAAALRAAAFLVGLQALALLAVTVFYVVELLVATSTSKGAAITSTVLVLLSALGLGWCAKGLYERRRWARSPVLVLQVIAIPVAVGLVQSGRWYVGGPLLVWVVAVIVLEFAPGSTAAFAGEDTDA